LENGLKNRQWLAIEEAEKQARIFLLAVKLWRFRVQKDPGLASSKEHGSLKRKSLDLTRVLADMRRSRR
jgi:hypothetical protein